MKKTDIAMIILIAGVCALAAFLVANQIPALKPSTSGEKVQTAEKITTDVTTPSTEIFNSGSINPTVQTVIGGGSTTSDK
jgi:hypothetical protein